MFWREQGAEIADKYGGDYVMSSVNAAETFTRILEKDPGEAAKAQILVLAMTIRIISFDAQQALMCAELRKATRASGLSLGDRACLALAKSRRTMAVTADRAWGELELGVEIKLIR